MVRVDGYGRAPVKDVALFADSHPFRDPFEPIGGRSQVQSTRRKPGVQMRMRRTPDSLADSRSRSARRHCAEDADEFVSREWQRSPWGGFEDHRIAQPTSPLDGSRSGLPAKTERPAGVSRGSRRSPQAETAKSRVDRPHSVGRYADGSGRGVDGNWMTYRVESREDLGYAAQQDPQRKSEVARARVRERATRLRREQPRLDRRLDRALQYLHNRSPFPENDPDPDGTQMAQAIGERMRRAWQHAEDVEDETAGRPPGDIERRRRWSDSELAYDAARHAQDELGPDFIGEPADLLRYTHQDTGRGAQPCPEQEVYSSGAEQALLSRREEGMRARLQQLRNEELARRAAEARQGPPPGWQQVGGSSGIVAPATPYPQPQRHTSADVYAAAVLAQQRALAADRAAAEMMRQRLALEQHNLAYGWSLAHLQQHLQAGHSQHQVMVGPDSTRWSGVPSLPGRHEPVTPYNPISVVPEGWEF